jgi:hypothetical protein
MEKYLHAEGGFEQWDYLFWVVFFVCKEREDLTVGEESAVELLVVIR